MADDIQEWAKDRVGKLMCGEAGLLSGDSRFEALRNAFARYIQQHEKPPADPALREVRKLFMEDHIAGDVDLFWEGVCCKHGGANPAIARGVFDGRPEISRYLAALRRGLELASQQGDG